MIRFKYKDFMGFPFSQSVQKLTSHSYPVKTAYAIKKLADAMQKQREKISAEYRAVIDKYATKDAEGKIVHPQAEDPNSFDVAEDRMAEYKATELAFGETEFTIDRPTLTLGELGSLELSAAELAQLDPLISGEPDASTGQIATVTQLPTAAEPVAPADTDSASPA